jgi:exonuclease VII large subunit
MKKYLFIITVFFLCANVNSQTIYTTQDAKDHIGDSVYVKGTVSEIFTSNKGNIFISFDDKYPANSFSVVIFKRNNIDISTIKVGSILTVCGTINSFNDKPQIILYSQEQIVKVE